MILGFSAALYGNFKDRTDQWESTMKTSREYQNREKEDEHDDRDYRKDFDRKTGLEQIWKGKNILTEKLAEKLRKAKK